MKIKEELRGQLGERLYGAFNLAAKAMNTSTKGLNDMLKKGEVLASDLLPKLSPLIKDLANNNGALEKQLESTRVAQNRLVLDMQDSADKIFQSGFSEGLKELYTELSTQLTETGKTQEDIGNIYNRFFKLITLGIKAVIPLIQSLAHSLSFVADIAYQSAKGYKEIYDAMERMNEGFGKTVVVASGLTLAFQSVFGKIMMVIGAVEELASLFDDNLVGALEQKLGFQVNIATGKTQQLTSVGDEVFDPMTYRALLKQDKMLLSQEDFTKKHGSATVEDALLERFGTALTSDIVKLQSGEKITVDSFMNSLSSGNGKELSKNIAIGGGTAVGVKMLLDLLMKGEGSTKANTAALVANTAALSRLAAAMGLGSLDPTKTKGKMKGVSSATRFIPHAVALATGYAMGEGIKESFLGGSKWDKFVEDFWQEMGIDKLRAFYDKNSENVVNAERDRDNVVRIKELKSRISELESTKASRGLYPDERSELFIKEQELSRIRGSFSGTTQLTPKSYTPNTHTQPSVANSVTNEVKVEIHNTGDTLDENEVKRIVTEVNNATQEALVQSYNSYRRGN